MTNTQPEDITLQEMTLEQTEEVRGSGLFSDIGSWIDATYQSFKESIVEKHS